MNKIVLDKSFLRGESSSKIKELSKNNTFLMPFSLLYELVKETPKERVKLFRKFQKGTPYLLLPTFHKLFQYETENNRPIDMPSSYTQERDYSLHEQLCDENFHLSQEQEKAIIQQKKDKDTLLKFFFPLIEEYINQKQYKKQEELEKSIVFNQEKIYKEYIRLQEFYNKTVLDKSRFNSNWFIYKWLQVLNLFAIDTAYRYDSLNSIQSSPNAREKLTHDMWDMEYLVFAVSEKSFATKEKKLIKWFDVLCHDGQLYT